MSVNPQPVEVQPYRPSLYLPGSLARFRQYPRVVQTPIPGAGYKVGRGVWGEQVLYLGGYGDLFKVGPTYPYGRYHTVPLRGLGQVTEVVPEQGENVVSKFFAVARRLWMGPTPRVEYGPNTATLRFDGVPPTNYSALTDYAKITAVGTFIGIPLMAFLGYRFGRRSALRANRRRRRS